MVSREYLLQAMLHELEVCKHLAGKLNAEDAEYRPSETQRSTIELMRYIASCGIGAMESLYTGDWKVYDAHEEAVETMLVGGFADAMDKQAGAIKTLFAEISDDDMLTKVVRAPGAGELPLGVAIMRTSYAWLVAYRHELFLRVKATSNNTIGTSNNWGGRDMKVKV